MRSLVVCALFLTGAAAQIPLPPANPNATPEARALLQAIYRVSGRNILSGQHNFPNHFDKWTLRALELGGKTPAIWGSDFGFTAEGKDAITARDRMIEEARRQHAAGSIVTLMWHVVRPTDDEPNGWKESVQAKLTNEQWTELTTPGTPLHTRWLKQIDTAAAYLKRLAEARIPVLWRPYHEANGAWFWWGGRRGPGGYQALYRMTFDRLVKHHRLDNLVWVWNMNAPTKPDMAYADFYPGPQYCDILAADVYGEFKQSYHDDLVALAAGKPVALGEVGRVPAPEVLKSQPRWAWFMIWADLINLNKPDALRALFTDPRTLSRGDPMPPSRLNLELLPGRLAICRLGPKAKAPKWAAQGAFTTVTRTADELSIVCPEASVPRGTKCERGRRAFRIAGTVDFALTGILASLASPLAQAGVSIFVVSTYDTDYLLVAEDALEKTVETLTAAGHTVRRP